MNSIKVFISAESINNNEDINDRANFLLGTDISQLRLKYIPIVGRYNGILERSYLVIADSYKEVAALVSLAANYKQECIMLVLPDSTAKLVYTADGRTTTIGKLVASTPEECSKLSGYSVVHGKYYTVKE
jgi:hypothetical protein